MRAGASDPSAPRARPTPVGGAVLAVAAVSGLAGLALHLAELTALACTLAAALLLAVAALRTPSDLAVHLSLASPRARAGGGITLLLDVRTVRGRGSPGRRLEIPHGPWDAADGPARMLEVDLPALAAGQHRTLRIPLATPHRGVLRIGPVHGVRADPLGLLHRRAVLAAAVRLPVRPALSLRPLAPPGLLAGPGDAASRRTTGAMAPVGVLGPEATLREHRPGDDARRIHWRSTLRSGQLMVREGAAQDRPRPLLVLDTDASRYAGAAEFERAISVTAAAALTAHREGAILRVLVGDRLLPAADAGALLDALASARRAPGGPPPARLCARALARAPGVSGIVLVTGASGARTAMREGLRVSGAPVQVIPCGSTQSAPSPARSRP